MDRARYRAYLTSPDWLTRRARFLRLARHLCADCGGRGWHVHHLSYDRLGHENDDDIVVLCEDCHLNGRHRAGQLLDG